MAQLLLRLLPGASVAILAVGSANAQIVPCAPPTAAGVVCLSGQLSDTRSGPLIGGVFHIVGPSSVPAGERLTVQGGAIVKVGAFPLHVGGTLAINAGCLFSSIHDDSAGGDTNGNGASTSPRRGDWHGILGVPGSEVIVDRAELRFGAGIGLVDAVGSFSGLVVRENGGIAALDLTGTSQAVATGCRFEDGDGLAVIGVPIGEVGNFTGCTASGNALGDYLRVESGTFPTGVIGLTIGIQNTLNADGVLVVGTGIRVPAAGRLTIASGMTLKFSQCCNATLFEVSGVLIADGVVFTSLKDDTQAGDTNKDGGATTPAAGDWERIRFLPTADGSVLAQGLCRYGGLAADTVLDVQADITMDVFVVERCAGHGMKVSMDARPRVTGCSFFDNEQIAVVGVGSAAVPGFSGNTALGNGAGDYIQVSDLALGALVESVTWSKGNTLNDSGLLVLLRSLAISSVGARRGALTIGAGVVVKAHDAIQIDVLNDGTLTCNGSAQDVIVFTSIHDDSVLGDSNKNGGATQPSAGLWDGIHFGSGSDASILDRVVIRFAGRSRPALRLFEADIRLTNSTIEQCANACLDLSGNSFPNVSGCAFNDSQRAVVNVPVGALAQFSSNTAAGNALGDHLEISSGAVTGPTTLGPGQALNGPRDGPTVGVFVVATGIVVDPGVTLTIEPDVVLKWRGGNGMTVNGTVHMGDPASGGVVLTSFFDDSVGGDTNGDGAATIPAPGDWRGIVLNNGADASTLDEVLVRYAGSANVAAVQLTSADATLRRCRVLDCRSTALDCGGNSAPSVSDCEFRRCGFAVDRLPVRALPGFARCIATSNVLGDQPRVTIGAVGGSLAIGSRHSTNAGPIVIATDVIVAAGAALTIEPMTVLKFDGARRVRVDGTLTVPGASAAGVTLTSIHDDTIGGDTNLNGNATSPQPGNWQGLDFGTASDASVIAGVRLRYGGAGGQPAVQCSLADIALSDSTIELAAGVALDLGGSSFAHVQRCRFLDCGGRATDRVPLRALPTWVDNLATGNALDAIRITFATLTAPVAIERHNTHNADGVLVFDVDLVVPAGDSLALGQGLIVKFDGPGRRIDVAGELDLAGTGLEPVVLTRIEDDAFGGDTNRDGAATVPQPGAWRGITWQTTAAQSFAEHARVRYAGGIGNAAAVVSRSGLLRMHALRADHSASHGIQWFALAGDAVNLVAYRCAGRGLDLASSTVRDVVHATVTECLGEGIAKPAASAARAINCISFRNQAGNYLGFAPNSIFGSDGDFAASGANGNLDVDPLFVAPLDGDLRLQPLSPCIDAASPTLAASITKDHVEASRALDHDLDALAAPDMGAFERGAWHMTVDGAPRIGGALAFTTGDGPQGAAFYLLGFLDGELSIPPLGSLLVGAPNNLLFIDVASTGQPLVLSLLVDPALAGLRFGVQAVVAPVVNPSGALQLVNLWRGTLRE